MGQRHQVYLRMPAVHYSEGNPNNRPTQIIGLHHQWLYGRTAIRMLANFMRWHAAAGEDKARLKYTPFGMGDKSNAEDLLAAIYSTDIAEGYWHNVHVFRDKDNCGEIANPYVGDNNDGITVIDLADIANPRYCLYTLDGIESSEERPPHTCISARDYVSAYYPSFKHRDGSDATDWIEPELAILDPLPVLTFADMLAIFPAITPSVQPA